MNFIRPVSYPTFQLAKTNQFKFLKSTNLFLLIPPRLLDVEPECKVKSFIFKNQNFFKIFFLKPFSKFLVIKT